jgi:hypothetical protein
VGTIEHRPKKKRYVMKIALVILVLFVSIDLTAQTGWKTVKDKTGDCQISVPPSWTLLSLPGHVNSPQGTTTMLISGHRPFRQFSDETIRVLNVDKVFENSAARVFYVGKPIGNPAHVLYHIEAPGKVNSCIAEIALQPHSLEDDAKKIALSLSKAP